MASSDVVLLEGESSKPVPIYVINDIIPELEETFRIELLNQTTGGAMLGTPSQAVITILPSDDPFGAFGETKTTRVLCCTFKLMCCTILYLSCTLREGTCLCFD